MTIINLVHSIAGRAPAVLRTAALGLQAALLAAGCTVTGGGPQIATAADRLQAAEQAYAEGRLVTAEAEYQAVLDQQPELTRAWLKLGNVYVRTGQLAAALGAYERCVAERPQEGRCWNNLAIVHLRRGMSSLQDGKRELAEQSDEWLALDLLYRRLARALSQEAP